MSCDFRDSDMALCDRMADISFILEVRVLLLMVEPLRVFIKPSVFFCLEGGRWRVLMPTEALVIISKKVGLKFKYKAKSLCLTSLHL